MYDVITIGSATKDVFLISKDFKLVKSSQFKNGMGECFSYGSKVEISDIYFDTGGGATNAAFTFSNLGLKTAIISKVGKDIYGLEIMTELTDKKVSTKNLAVDHQHQTAYSTILISPSGERTVLVYRGASANFSAADFNWSNLKTKWLYITSLAGNFELLKKIFVFAKKNKIKIAWNPGGEELKLGPAKLKELISQSYVFDLNMEEAQKLTGKTAIKDIFSVINKMSPGYNVVTDGGNGVYLSDGMLVYHAQAIGSKPVNTTGAGDAFGSAFCTGLILKNDWDYALRLGILNADGVIKGMGAKHGLLSKIPAEQILKKVKIGINS